MKTYIINIYLVFIIGFKSSALIANSVYATEYWFFKYYLRTELDLSIVLVCGDNNLKLVSLKRLAIVSIRLKWGKCTKIQNLIKFLPTTAL